MTRMGCAVVACRRKECPNGRGLLVGPLLTRLTGVDYRLRSRKGNGNRACREKACDQVPQIWSKAQSKMCMVKALMPEFQFPVAKGLAVANAAETLHRARWSALPCAIHHQFARDDFHRKVKETNGTPKHIATPQTRNYGIACSRFANGPVWRRSRHSTQTPGVMAGTAVRDLGLRRTTTRIRLREQTESASGWGKDDAANNGMCSMQRQGSSTERFC